MRTINSYTCLSVIVLIGSFLLNFLKCGSRYKIQQRFTPNQGKEKNNTKNGQTKKSNALVKPGFQMHTLDSSFSHSVSNSLKKSVSSSMKRSISSSSNSSLSSTSTTSVVSIASTDYITKSEADVKSQDKNSKSKKIGDNDEMPVPKIERSRSYFPNPELFSKRHSLMGEVEKPNLMKKFLAAQIKKESRQDKFTVKFKARPAIQSIESEVKTTKCVLDYQKSYQPKSLEPKGNIKMIRN